MTWLCHMIASIIGTPTVADTRKANTDLLWDGRLCRCVFQLVQMIDFRLNNSAGKVKCDEKLELAILIFFRSFKKCYLLDSVNAMPGMGSSVLGMAPGASPAHPLLSLALSYTPDSLGGEGGDKSGGDGSGGSSMEPTTVYEAMNIGDNTSIMNIIVEKMCNNIKYWHRSDVILQETLEVLVELVSSYNSSKTLLSLDTVNFLVHNHIGAIFPFLGYDSDNKYRIIFYSALSRLVFTSSEDLNNLFDIFIQPNIAILQQLSQTSDLRSTPAVKIAIIGMYMCVCMYIYSVFVCIIIYIVYLCEYNNMCCDRIYMLCVCKLCKSMHAICMLYTQQHNLHIHVYIIVYSY